VARTHSADSAGDAGSTDTVASFPTRYLPPPQVRELPQEPQRFLKLVGPGIIAAGVGLASGEFILFPYIASQVGLVFVWAALVGLITQFFINMEIERYALATGETALTGFSRYWRHWGLVFALLTYFANLWPGWATSSATLVTYLFGGNPRWIAIGMLITIGLILTLAPVVYVALERAQMLKVAAVLLMFAVAAVVAIGASAWQDLPKVVTEARIPAEELGFALLLGALAFAGAGGGQNLVQANWIRDKGFGMGSHIPHVVSPLTGEDQAKPSTGYMVRQDDENLERFWGWWKVAKKEQFYFFFVTGLITIMVFSLLAYSTVFGQDLGEQLDFVEGEGNALKDAVAPWFGTVFWGIGAVSLFAGSLGILDYVARVSADVIKTLYARESQRITESWVYFGFVWGEIALGTIVLLSGFDQPLALLIVASSLNGVVMFIYSLLLIKLNRQGLPVPIRVRGLRLYLLWAIAAVFGGLSVALLLAQI
jgi:hypothetical protein